MKSETAFLIGLPPGTRVVLPGTDYIARLVSVNECRAVVKIERSPISHEEGREQNWAPTTEVIVPPKNWTLPRRETSLHARVKAATVLQALQAHSEWIERLPKKPRAEIVDRDCRVSNIVQGALCIMAGSAHCDIHQWIAHRPHRKQLKQPIKAVWNRDGRKAIQELLELTISEIEASKSFRPKVTVGPLPIGDPCGHSAANLHALARGRETQKKQRVQRRVRCAVVARPAT